VIGMDALEVTAARLDPASHRRIAIQQDVRRDQFFYALYESCKAKALPCAMSAAELRRCAAEEAVEEIYETNVDTRILAWLAIERDAMSHPAEPLYARAPDAKLPGGKSV